VEKRGRSWHEEILAPPEKSREFGSIHLDEDAHRARGL